MVSVSTAGHTTLCILGHRVLRRFLLLDVVTLSSPSWSWTGIIGKPKQNITGDPEGLRQVHERLGFHPLPLPLVDFVKALACQPARVASARRVQPWA